MELIVENVRCFRGRHAAPLAPITILVGENSSGKSTIVAMARVAWDAISRGEAIDFNEEPFQLGAFDDIVTVTDEGRCNNFSVGFSLPIIQADTKGEARKFADNVDVTITYGGQDAQPNLAEWVIQCGDYSVRYSPRLDEGSDPIIRFKTPSTDFPFPIKEFPVVPSVFSVIQYWQYFQMRLSSKDQGLFGKKLSGQVPKESELRILNRIISNIGTLNRTSRPYASAPIRTRPRRTYDPLTETPTPEGGHVPMVLAKLKVSKPTEWATLKRGLELFGGAAGLFEALDVKRMGGDEANLPFQLRVGLAHSPQFNLVDVGYGVSQVLPILVDAISNRNRILLLQQPEVHLHPRAQAELGSFLARLAADEHRSAPILLETHSDHLVDRIRMDIRDKKSIKASDVVILYLARSDSGVSISSIRVDENGNLIDVPAGYRSFFMEEERRFLQS